MALMRRMKMMKVRRWERVNEVSMLWKMNFADENVYGVGDISWGMNFSRINPMLSRKFYSTRGYWMSRYRQAAMSCMKSSSCKNGLILATTPTPITTKSPTENSNPTTPTKPYIPLSFSPE
jgi:hypothetical protein